MARPQPKGTTLHATLEPRLVMKGNEDKPFISGKFLVAAYQRGYRWGPEEVTQLLDDLYANARDADQGIRRDYFLQPIVVLPRADQEWELVDGQQRLTTLYLLVKYLSEQLQASVEYTLTYESREDSHDFLNTLDQSLRTKNIDYHHIANAYDAIKEWFAGQSDPGGAAIEIRQALTKRVYVIWYEAPKGTNANELFTRLNRDRIALTDSELIKALVLSKSGATNDQAGRQEEIAAQWDNIERDLRDEQFWAFLNGSSKKKSTHIDFLFESMAPRGEHKDGTRYWTFGKVRDDIEDRGVAKFWRDVVERHGLLTGWYQDRTLYHRIGYLVAIGDSVPELIALSRKQTQSEFKENLTERTRERLGLTRNKLSELRYGKDGDRCNKVLLLMNIETVLVSIDPGSRFSFHSYAEDGWSLEHIHAQNTEDFKTERQRRDWLQAHGAKIKSTQWPIELQENVDAVIKKIDAHLTFAPGKTDDFGFQTISERVFDLFATPGSTPTEDDLHGLGNLALLQRAYNSKLNNAVFALKRERILELDQDGAYIVPCTRNVFLKYYTRSEDQQLSIWSPQDQKNYYQTMLNRIDGFLLPDPAGTTEETA